MDINNILTIEIGGKQRKLYYGLNSLEVFSTEMGIKDLTTITQEVRTLKGVKTLIYALAYVGDIIDGNEIDYNIMDVGFWIDNLSQADLNIIISKFYDANILGSKEEPKTVSKKKK